MTLPLEDKDTLVALEEMLWRAETRFDPALMDLTFSPHFVEFGRSGRRYERAEMLFNPEQRVDINATLPLPDYSVELVAPGVALATYTSEVRYGDQIEVGRRSSLWVKYDGRWQLRFHQGTPL
ncbi:MAG: nuclear transport factor 2 family protein [Pseudomonadota bacterium]